MHRILVAALCVLSVASCGSDPNDSPRAHLAQLELRSVRELLQQRPFAANIPRTPNTVPCGPVAWPQNAPGFSELGYHPTYVTPFSLAVSNDTHAGQTVITAYADHDCDHVYATYEMAVDGEGAGVLRVSAGDE
ncbi:MAG: hypothetical protein IPK60_00175 [Sandaracinaceae bacterium]|nr:hypothetical protein [Sandaracinaceae bacterium]